MVNSRLVENIENYIYENGLRSGDRLPPEREFCEILCVSRVTLRQAVKKLCEAGRLTNIQGKGTFLAEERIARDLMQIEASPLDTYKLIGIQKLCGSGNINIKLKLQPRSEVYQIKRIRMTEGVRISIEISYIPVSYLKAIDFGQLEEKAMYSFYNKELKGRLTKKDIHISIGKADFEESEWLGIKENAPVAVEKHLIFQEKTPVEYLISVSSVDKIQYIAELRADEDGNK